METEKVLEALLFVSGEPLSMKDLARLSETNAKEVVAALHSLEERLQERGICLLRHEDTVSLGTAPAATKATERLVKERLESDLSRFSLETLAIILWKGRVSRASIDYIRGVNSTFSLRTLLIRGLIQREQDSRDARVYLYSPTMDLLRHLGVSSLKDLPEFESMQNELKDHD